MKTSVVPFSHLLETDFFNTSESFKITGVLLIYFMLQNKTWKYIELVLTTQTLWIKNQKKKNL